MTIYPIIDTQALDAARETLKAKFTTMVGYFIEDGQGYVTSICAAVDSGNPAAVADPAHALKSSSLQMGARRLSELARQLESLAREQAQPAAFKPLAQELQAVFAQTSQQLQSQAA